MEYALQLYSVRDMADKDMEGAIKAVSEIGYKKVEFAGFGNVTAAEAAQLLKKYGLKVVASHLGLGEVDPEHIEKTIEDLKTIGDVNPVVPGISLSTKEKLDNSIEILNFANARFKKEGMTLHFHNHFKEFLPNEDGQIPFDELYYRTSLRFEVDTYWAFSAKRDPVRLMERLAGEGRLNLIHIKDGTSEMKGSAGRPLGLGCAPVKEVYNAAIKLGAEIIVESETLQPSGIEEARICFDYLKSLEK
ncbi:MAG: sugar phosphate isomerase/epimerase [Clostridia bacterium]|nr:sugar phosphate isomerase/epimerase [Clostridia bacterium]